MRVLYIIPTLGIGGAEKLLSEIVPFIHEHEKNTSIQLLVLTKKKDNFSGKIKKSGGVVAFLTNNLSVYNPINILKIRKYIKKGEFDIVHAHLFPVQYWVILALMGVRKKPFLFFTEHSTNNSRRNYSLFRPIERFIYRGYDHIISISEQVEMKLLTWLNWDPRKRKDPLFTIISNGIDLEKINNAVSLHKSDLDPALTSDIRVICMVGRFVPAKDQATLMRSLTLLDDNVHLVLVGDGETLSNHKKLADELGISMRVHFLGFRTDVERILKTVDVVVLSSFWEGFGIAVVEGLAAGKPVVASNVGGLREVICDDELLFPVGNYKKLSLIINKLLIDKKFYNEKSKQARKRSTSFSITNTVKEHVNLYRQLVTRD